MRQSTSDPGSTSAARHGAAYVERARRLAPMVAAQADAIEAGRRLPESVLAALIDGGLYRMLLPRPLNGAEIDPVSFFETIEAIAKADASTAWCLCQASGCSMAAAFLHPDIAAEIFAHDPRAILAWGPGAARAVAVEGGYRVTGKWSFASGGRHATWLGGYAPIHEPDGTPRRNAEGTAIGRTMLFPAARVEMIDIWQVIGLRGTGSDAFAVADLFVPQDYTVARDDQKERRYPGPLYWFPANSIYGSGFAAVALGIARSTLDAFIDLARDKTPRGFKTLLRDNAVIQSEVAQAEARLRSARLYLTASLTEIWRAVEQTNMLSVEQRMQIRLAATHAINQAKDVVDTAYHAAGATAIFASSAFERRFRDMHTVAQQVQGRQSHFETVGQFLLGLTPDLTFC